MKRFVKITGFTFTGIIGVLAVLFMLISSGILNPWINKTISENAGNFIEGELSISKINGNLFSHFTLEGVEISSENKKLIQIENIEIDYRLLPVLHKKIDVRSIKLNGLQAFLEKEENQKWNFEKLIKQNDSIPADTIQSDFNWEINLNEIRLESIETFIKTGGKSSIPEYAKLNAELNISFNPNDLKIDLNEFDLTTKNPEFTINSFTFNIQNSGQKINWQNLLLQLPESKIQSNGTVPLDSIFNSQINLTASPFNFEDFKAWLPDFYGSPEITVNIQNNISQNNIDIQIIAENQKLNVDGIISGNIDMPEYELNINAENLNGEYWFQNPDYNSLINGELKLSGKGIDFQKNNVTILANFKDIKYDTYDFSGIQLNVNKESGNISGNMKAGTFFGNVVSEFKIDELFGNPDYNIKADLSHLNLSKVTGDKRFKSDINVGIRAKGKGIDLADLTTEIQLYSKKSVLFGQPVSDFNTQFTAVKGNYNLHKFRLETPYFLCTLNGKGNIANNNNIDFNINVKEVEKITSLFSEKELKISANLTGNISGPSDKLSLLTDLNLPYFSYDSLQIENAVAKIESSIYGQKLTWKNISSDLQVYQQNLDPEKMDLTAQAQIGKAKYENYSLSDFILNFEKNNDNLNGTLSTQILNGEIISTFNITHLFSLPEYTIQSKLNHLNINETGWYDKLWSDLNLEIDLTGAGDSPETIIAELSFKSNGSTFQGMRVSDFNTSATYKNGEYNLTGFTLETPMASLKAEAAGDINKNTNISFHFLAHDFKNYAGNFNINNLELEGGIEGKLSGKTDSLQLLTLLNFINFKYDTIQIRKIQGKTDIWLVDSLYSGTVNLLSNNIKIQELDVNEIKFDSEINNQTVNSTFSFFASDSLNGKVRILLKQEQNPKIYIPEIDLNIYKNHWQNNSNTSYIEFGTDSIQIHEFNLQSEESSIKANGIFSFHGNENLQLEINNLNIINIPGLQLLPYKFSGIINSNSSITGTAEMPVFTGFFDVASPAVDSLKFSRFYTSVNYAEKKLELNSYIDDNSKRLILANAEIPFDFSLTGDLNSLIKTTPINAHLKLDELEINQFNRFIPVKGTEVNGTISMDVTLSNTIDSLLVAGKFQLANGKFNYAKYGMNYQNIILNSQFNNNEFLLDSFRIYSGNGSLALKGNAALNSFTQLPENFNFQLEGKNFRAFNSELIKAFIDTRLNVTGTAEYPMFSGNMTINRSTLNTDIFLREYNRIYDTSEEPLLVQAQKNQNISFQIPIAEKDSLKKPQPDIYKNLKGQFDIQIPGNTWIKGKNMNFEIAGNLKVLKENEQIDLFGNMNVKRGFYKIYGRKLDFEEGEITLTGGQTIDPNVNFVIGYKFRDPDKTLRKLNINIKGQVSKPEFSFKLDDTSIEEKDAISYLIFNKSLNQLDNKENSTVTSSNLDMAKDLALVQITNIVKDVLQTTIGLDVIEFSGIKGGTEGSVSLGKYITNNLYLNYERNFALDKKNKQIEPEKISLEYQIMRSLFLQAINQKTNSGFDFIFKWTWK